MHVDRSAVTGSDDWNEPDGWCPKAMNPPWLFPDHGPEGSWCPVANATPNRIPPGWRPETDGDPTHRPDEPVGRAPRTVAAALGGTSLFDPESFAPRKRHPPGEPRAAHLGEWSCLSSREPLRPKTRRTRNPRQPGAALVDPGASRPEDLETPDSRWSVPPGNQG